MQPWQSQKLSEIETRYRALAAEYERQGHARADFRRQWRKCAELGLLAFSPAGKAEASGLSAMVAAYEGFAQGGPAAGLLFALAAHLLSVQFTLETSASKSLRDTYLPGMAGGQLVAAHAVTEEAAGSDVLAMQTTASREGTDYRLEGRKSYITAGAEADIALVFARTAADPGPFSLSAFLVDLSSPGVGRGRQFQKLGLSGARMGELIFKDVRLPADHLIGAEGAGLSILSESTTWERALLPMTLLGAMKQSLEECKRWAGERVQFGRPIAHFQQVSAQIADMVAAYQVSRILIYDMAARLRARRSARSLAQEAAICKLTVSEQAVQLQRRALQVMGVRGYLRDSPIARNLSDALGSTLWSGTSETLRNTVARLAGLPGS